MTVGAPDGATPGELTGVLAGSDCTGPAEPPPGSDTAGVGETEAKEGSETGVVTGIVSPGPVLTGDKLSDGALGVTSIGPIEPPSGKDAAGVEIGMLPPGTETGALGVEIAGTEAGSDPGTEAGTDSGIEAGSDAPGVETGSDASIPELGSDAAGVETTG